MSKKSLILSESNRLFKAAASCSTLLCASAADVFDLAFMPQLEHLQTKTPFLDSFILKVLRLQLGQYRCLIIRNHLLRNSLVMFIRGLTQIRSGLQSKSYPAYCHCSAPHSPKTPISGAIRRAHGPRHKLADRQIPKPAPFGSKTPRCPQRALPRANPGGACCEGWRHRRRYESPDMLGGYFCRTASPQVQHRLCLRLSSGTSRH